MNVRYRITHLATTVIVGLSLLAMATVSFSGVASAGMYCGNSLKSTSGHEINQVKTSIDLGCKGKGNPVLDLLFAVIRFLTGGAALIIVGSMIVAGLQYTSSRGNPQATTAAINRIRSNVIALLVLLFAYAILNYLIPGQVLK